MSTRSGLVFRVETTMAEKEAVSMSDILRLLVETQHAETGRGGAATRGGEETGATTRGGEATGVTTRGG